MSQSVPPREVVENWNRVFEALSAEPRRQLLVALMDTDDEIALPEAAANPDVEVDPERLRTNLYHQHLPALADHEFVEWDDDPLVARRGPQFDQVEAVFQVFRDNPGQLPQELVEGCKHLDFEQSPEE